MPGRTQGTETSQYLQEEKENIDGLSSGERKGRSPNRACFGTTGVVGAAMNTMSGTGTVWKGGAERVTPPYGQRGMEKAAT